jgi:hypothetical protein
MEEDGGGEVNEEDGHGGGIGRCQSYVREVGAGWEKQGGQRTAQAAIGGPARIGVRLVRVKDVEQSVTM